MHWPAMKVDSAKLVIFLLIFSGFLKEFRPILPFMNTYLTSSARNFTDDTLNHQVYPVWTYSYMALLLPVLLLSDNVHHFTFVIIGTFGQLCTMLAMIYGTTVACLQLMEIAYGLTTACDISSMSFLFFVVGDLKKFQKIISIMRAVTLLGMCISYVIGQLFLWFGVTDYTVHAYVSLTASVATVLLVLFICLLRKVWLKPRTMHRRTENDTKFSIHFLTVLFYRLKKCYHSIFVIKWSIFWAISTCGYLQVVNYIQLLWSKLQDKNDNSTIYNGITEAVNALYLIATHAPKRYHALAFGSNTFIALLLQTVLTLIVADSNGFALDISSQFNVYGILHGTVSVFYLISGIVILAKHWPINWNAFLETDEELNDSKNANEAVTAA
ncbi:thiamine transporter 2 [Trichinella spiralis]|uniref:Folate transporter 1 n=1 Tax=Trichinella spiralis TaxID=6334 RepID=E5SHS1_TRISP|nr:thiamine transporter 2 [Trichinella spiralis]KRY35948.1 Folate transporter 1 [Trichinella spiralis]